MPGVSDDAAGLMHVSALSGLTELLRQTCQSAVKPVGHTAFKSGTTTLIDIQCYVSAHLRDADLSIDDVSRVSGLPMRYIYVLFAPRVRRFEVG